MDVEFPLQQAATGVDRRIPAAGDHGGDVEGDRDPRGNGGNVGEAEAGQAEHRTDDREDPEQPPFFAGFLLLLRLRPLDLFPAPEDKAGRAGGFFDPHGLALLPYHESDRRRGGGLVCGLLLDAEDGLGEAGLEEFAVDRAERGQLDLAFAGMDLHGFDLAVLAQEAGEAGGPGVGFRGAHQWRTGRGSPESGTKLAGGKKGASGGEGKAPLV
jgi:hypothetical protein